MSISGGRLLGGRERRSGRRFGSVQRLLNPDHVHRRVADEPLVHEQQAGQTRDLRRGARAGQRFAADPGGSREAEAQLTCPHERRPGYRVVLFGSNHGLERRVEREAEVVRPGRQDPVVARRVVVEVRSVTRSKTA